LLQEMEIPVSLSHPLKTKAIASARIKTDKLDAATLAQLLRADLLPRAHLSSPQARLDRELLRHRATLVRLRTAVKNRVHALLAKHNLVFAAGGLFTAKGGEWLAGLALSPLIRGGLDRMLTPRNAAGLRLVNLRPGLCIRQGKCHCEPFGFAQGRLREESAFAGDDSAFVAEATSAKWAVPLPPSRTTIQPS